MFDTNIDGVLQTNDKTSFQEADLRVEELEKKTSKLELELEEAERGRGWKGVRGLCIERKGERGKAALCMFEI